MSEFKNSVAQDNVQFPIETVLEALPGAQYSKAIIFIPLSLANTYLPGVTTPTAGMKVSLNVNSYAEVSGGKLKSWLVPFFESAQTAEILVAVYDVDTPQDGEDPIPATAPIADVYAAYKEDAYFKFGLAGDDDYNALQVQLSQLCLTDPLYSQLWIGTSDEGVLTKTSALITSLNGVNSNARVIYNPDSDINPALAQLGRTLSTLNVTGTPVGNDVDMSAFGTIEPSGGDDADGNPTNLTSLQKAALDEQRIGYQTYVGDGTENVATEGSMTLKGEVCGALWVKAYIEYMCKVRTATLITRMNAFRNNQQYQAILLLLSDIVSPFVDMGRLTQFTVTAPTFAQLPASADGITVPNAWNATYVDRIRSVTVYGTLYITKPSK